MTLRIQEIQAEHDIFVRDIIRSVGAEFGAVGEGFGPSDPEVEAMSQYYGQVADRKRDQHAHNFPMSCYFVALLNDRVVGGCGIAPFNGREDVCELRKLFLLPECRGLGVGKALTETCIEFAKQAAYESCYLDTLKTMKGAIALYEKLGFDHLSCPFEGTIHGGCDVWMIKSLIGSSSSE